MPRASVTVRDNIPVGAEPAPQRTEESGIRDAIGAGVYSDRARRTHLPAPRPARSRGPRMVRRTGPRRPRLITDQTTSRRQHFGARQVRPPTNWSRKRPASLAVSGGMSSRTPENWVRRKTGPPSAEESRKGLTDDRNRAEQNSEERRVGKEGVSKCRSRWSPYD